MPEGRRTREELIQIEYELYGLLLEEQRRARRRDPAAIAAEFFQVDVSEIASVSEDVRPPDIIPVQLLLGQHAQQVDVSRLAGSDPSTSVTWATVEIGKERVRVPEDVSLPFPAGTVAEVPLFVRAWPQNNGMTLQVSVMSRRQDSAAAAAYLEALISDACGPRSPYLHQLIEASAGPFGPRFRIVDLEPIDRTSLVLPAVVWEAVYRNIDRMFERMDRLRAAGLGTNRGLILAGPPGTGKSALCRALAHDYKGRATVTIVSASAGQYVLGQLYERLDPLGPALVLIEDLDLLVGDRDEQERFPLIQFLTVLDGLMTHHSRVVTVATTNDTNLVDAAATRAARFDQVVKLELPDEPTRAAILSLYLRKLEHEADVTVLAAAAKGFSGADLREVVRSAVLDAESTTLTHRDLYGALLLRKAHLERAPAPSTGSYL